MNGPAVARDGALCALGAAAFFTEGVPIPDWGAGEVSSFGFGLEIRHDDMLWLEKHGKAKPFEVRSLWRRKFTWRLRIVRDPATGVKRIVGVGNPQWTDAK